MIRVYLSGDPVHDRVLKAFYEGCGAEKELVEGFNYKPSDVAVVFGVYKSKIPKSFPRGKIIQRQREKKLDVIVLETGYVNRGDGENHHYAAGWNGLNGRADFKNEGMDGERWRMLGVQLRPYSRGENVILCGQVPWDASVDHSDHLAWLKHTAAELRRLTVRPIIFRSHPLAKVPAPKGLAVSTAPLDADLPTAHAVITYNSNSAVEALIAGKAVFAFDEGSMVWGVCNKNLDDLEAPQYPADRQQWANDIAYAQWNLDEMREGLAWKHLTR